MRATATNVDQELVVMASFDTQIKKAYTIGDFERYVDGITDNYSLEDDETEVLYAMLKCMTILQTALGEGQTTSA